MMADKVYVIAEAGVNHNGSLDRAVALVCAAAAAGADAVKFQTFRADRLASRFAAKARYQQETTDPSESQLEMLRKLELSEADHAVLVAECRRLGIDFLSSAFDAESMDFLCRETGIRQIKIPSGEATNAPLLLHAARKNLPVLLSTGMCNLADIEQALTVLAWGFLHPQGDPLRDALARAYASAPGRAALLERVTVLHCVTDYPAAAATINLRAMDVIAGAFGLAVGYSDHTLGYAVALAAVARGATVIEKHFTLDRDLPGPDHRASLLPQEFAAMVAGIREVGQALGIAAKLPGPAELANLEVARRSLVALRDICRGESFDRTNLGTKRPGSGIPPHAYWDFLGRAAGRDYAADELIEW